MRRAAVTGLIITFLLIAGCSQKTLAIKEPWARPGSQGGTGAVYFVIENPTNQPDTLQSASSDVAENVEIHMTMMQENESMTMVHQNAVPVPANGTVEFKPGGLHVMLINLNRDLKTGDQFTITLNFQNAGEIPIDAEVKEIDSSDL